MKKVIFPLILFLALSGAFAAAFEFKGNINDNSGHISKGQDASTNLVLDNTTTVLSNVGFTLDYEAVTSLEAVVPTVSSYELTVDREKGLAKSKENELYVFYQIKSGEALIVSLYGDLLEGENHSDSIFYDVSCNGSTLEVANNTGYDNNITIYTHEPTTKYGAYKVYPLSIETKDLWSKPADLYKANLYIDVRVKE